MYQVSIHLPRGKRFSLSLPIETLLDLADRVVILLIRNPKDPLLRNVLCLDMAGNLLWQIIDPANDVEGLGYTSIELAGPNLQVSDGQQFYLIDLKTGGKAYV